MDAMTFGLRRGGLIGGHNGYYLAAIGTERGHLVRRKAGRMPALRDFFTPSQSFPIVYQVSCVMYALLAALPSFARLGRVPILQQNNLFLLRKIFIESEHS